MGGSKKQVQEVKDTSPWVAQQPYLTDAFSQAKSIYNSQQGAGPYTGEFFATPNQDQLDTFRGALSYSNGAGADAATTTTNNGLDMQNAGATATQGALHGLQDYNNTDWTSKNIDNAQKYAQGFDVDGLVRAGMMNANRNAAENVLPSLYRNSQASGNLDGSRQALSEGVVSRGLNDQAQALTAQYGAQAYTTGLSNAQMDRAGALAGLQGQASAGNQAYNSGVAGTGAGMQDRNDLYSLAAGASDKLQTFDQSAIDNERSKYDYAQQFPWQNLNNYMSIVGGQNWGSHSTGTSVTEDKPSTMSTVGSVLGGLGSFASMFKCDERLKTVVLRNFGYTNSGVPLHVFFYRDDPDRRLTIGPMAQEVALTHPDAVVDFGGVLMVDISKLCEDEAQASPFIKTSEVLSTVSVQEG